MGRVNPVRKFGRGFESLAHNPFFSFKFTLEDGAFSNGVNNKGLTLVEIIISSVIFSVMLLAIMQAVYFSAAHFKGRQEESAVQTEVSFAMHHLTRHLIKAVKIDFPALGVTDDEVQVTIDEYTGPGYPASSPVSPIKVRYVKVGDELQFGKGSATPVIPTEVIAHNITQFDITRTDDSTGNQGISFIVEITAREPDTGAEFSLQSRITTRCMPWRNP
ncbi:MAG: hypothetical protein B5M48_02275 [Candidatus Omnitrophica bacterium 4484_213]|nr:MAG: hypothetical protein B5M48_02275 [Candidatus Omnitrophica bacterium 4484_213]